MATVTKTWVFASNAEGLVEVGDFAGTQFGWTSAYGSPATGSVNFISGLATYRERARTGTGVTWETWGVPAGSTVTQVQITNWRLLGIAPNVQTGNHYIRIVNSSNTTVHSAGDLVSKAATVTTWTTYTDGVARAVDASYQASTTAVKLELEVNPPMAYSDKSEVCFSAFDTIELTITYTAASTGIVPILMSLFRRWRF